MSFSSYGALVTVGDILLGNILARGFHQLDLDTVLNFLHGHPLGTGHADTVGDFLYQRLVLAAFGGEHGFADSRFDFLFVVPDHPAVSFLYKLNHFIYFLERLFR